MKTKQHKKLIKQVELNDPGAIVCCECSKPMEDGTGYTITKGENEGNAMCEKCYEN